MLAETPEYPSDALLAQYARLQLIEDDVCQAPWIEGEGISSDSRAPSSYHLKSLEAQMKAFKQQLPTELQQNGLSMPYCTMTWLMSVRRHATHALPQYRDQNLQHGTLTKL